MHKLLTVCGELNDILDYQSFTIVDNFSTKWRTNCGKVFFPFNK